MSWKIFAACSGGKVYTHLITNIFSYIFLLSIQVYFSGICSTHCFIISSMITGIQSMWGFFALITSDGKVFWVISKSSSMSKPDFIKYSLNETGRHPVKSPGKCFANQSHNLLIFFVPNEKVDMTTIPWGFKTLWNSCAILSKVSTGIRSTMKLLMTISKVLSLKSRFKTLPSCNLKLPVLFLSLFYS